MISQRRNDSWYPVIKIYGRTTWRSCSSSASQLRVRWTVHDFNMQNRKAGEFRCLPPCSLASEPSAHTFLCSFHRSMHAKCMKLNVWSVSRHTRRLQRCFLRCSRTNKVCFPAFLTWWTANPLLSWLDFAWMATLYTLVICEWLIIFSKGSTCLCYIHSCPTQTGPVWFQVGWFNIEAWKWQH